MRSQLVSACLISGCLCLVLSCGRQSSTFKGTDSRNGIKLGQDVTNTLKPQDVIFLDFEKNWRKFISTSKALTLPVVPIREPEKKSWQPIVQAECVFSGDAGGNVPLVTLTWTEPQASNANPVPRSPALKTSFQEQRGQEPAASAVRFDLAVHYQGFARNYYSTILSTGKLQRFNLPSNSALVANPDAVLLTGPSLFPKLMDFRTEMVKDEENVEIPRLTLAVRDLAPGLAYTLRKVTLGNNEWNEEKQFAFSTPVCPKEF